MVTMDHTNTESFYRVTGITFNSTVYNYTKKLVLEAMDHNLCNITDVMNEHYALVPVKKYQELYEDSRRLNMIKEWMK